MTKHGTTQSPTDRLEANPPLSTERLDRLKAASYWAEDKPPVLAAPVNAEDLRWVIAQAERIAEAEAERDRLKVALTWYAHQAEGCRKLGSIGEPFRNALDADGGKRARRALSPSQSEGEKA